MEGIACEAVDDWVCDCGVAVVMLPSLVPVPAKAAAGSAETVCSYSSSIRLTTLMSTAFPSGTLNSDGGTRPLLMLLSTVWLAGSEYGISGPLSSEKPSRQKVRVRSTLSALPCSLLVPRGC